MSSALNSPVLLLKGGKEKKKKRWGRCCSWASGSRRRAGRKKGRLCGLLGRCPGWREKGGEKKEKKSDAISISATCRRWPGCSKEKRKSCLRSLYSSQREKKEKEGTTIRSCDSAGGRNVFLLFLHRGTTEEKKKGKKKRGGGEPTR